MNPYGIPGDGNIFQTQANQGANNFNDPLNIAHLYPGWGTNPNYQTPSYDAPYRPAYQGPNPYATYAKPSYAGGISQLYSPFYKDPYWGNPVSNNQNAFNSVGQKPFDATMAISQRFIAPAVIMGMTQATMGRIGGNIGSGFIGGLAEGLGAGTAASGAAGWMGGAFGSVAIPFVVGQAITRAVDSAVFQPYIRSRQMAGQIQDSFAGMTFAGGYGNPISGRGLSGQFSAKLGGQIDKAGIGDMTFSANQYGGIAAMGMRAGLFDDTGAADITNKVKSIAAQIKMIVSISKDPNIQNAIEQLAQLRMGGASTTGGAASVAAGAYSSIGMYASAAGASVQRVMNTVGAQGQYMFQMNGLTPYLGQVSAANAFSGFASAQRTGVLSTAQLARMGGIEGATQSVISGQLAAMSTPFNRMRLANQFMGGGLTSGVTDTVGQFGALASGDPLKLMGAMSLYGNQMLSSQAGSEGVLTAEKTAVAMLRNQGRQPGPNGYDPAEVAAMMQSMGMTPEQVQAYASLRASQTNSGSVSQQMAGFRSQLAEQNRQITSQYGTYNGGVMGAVSSARRGFKGLRQGIANIGYTIAEAAGWGGDTAGSVWDSLVYGNTISDKVDGGDIGINMDGVTGSMKKGYGSTGSDGQFMAYLKGEASSNTTRSDRALDSLDSFNIIGKINDAARGNGPGSDIARKLLKSGFKGGDAKELFAKFVGLQTGSAAGRMQASLEKSSSLFDHVSRDVAGNIVEIKETEKNSGIMKATGLNSLDEALMATNQADEIMNAGGPIGLSLEDKLNSGKYSALNKALGNGNTSSKVDKLRSIVDSGLARNGIKGGSSSMTDEARRSYLANAKAFAESTGKTMTQSASEVDWKLFTDGTKNIAEGGKLILEAANILTGKTQGKSPFLQDLHKALYPDEKQKKVDK
jgi:hypothetical protein